MGCSRGRRLFHRQRVSSQRCWVICKATSGRRRLAQWPLPPRGHVSALEVSAVLRAAPLSLEGCALGRRSFSLEAGLVGLAAGVGNSRERTKRCTSCPFVPVSAVALNSRCCSICWHRAAVSNLLLRPPPRPCSHRSHQELGLWLSTHHVHPLLLPADRWHLLGALLWFEVLLQERCSHRGLCFATLPQTRWSVLAVGYKTGGGMKDSGFSSPLLPLGCKPCSHQWDTYLAGNTSAGPEERQRHVGFVRVGIHIYLHLCARSDGRRPRHFGWEDFMSSLLS